MRAIIMLIVVVALIPLGYSATIYVPDDYTTIQEAIDAAMNGDIVVVGPGTYVENIDFKGKAITVKSEKGKEVTVIDGGNPFNPDYRSVVIFHHGEGSDSRLEGFTITNGTGTLYPGSSYYNGGGIYCRDNSSPTIINNSIINNSVKRCGGGIYLHHCCSPEISGNNISNNLAVYGGGLFCWENSSPLIKNNSICMNVATYEGGGIQGETNCSPTIDSNVIEDNSGDMYAGGILFWNECSPTITNNIIIGNKAVNDCGGGILITYYCSGTIAKNIIAYNTAKGTTYSGGGILIDRFSDTKIINNMIYGNTSTKGGGIDINKDSSPTIINNTIYGNSSDKGGGMACRSGSTATIVNTVLWDNNATKGSEIFIGAAMNPSTVTISFSDVKGNQSTVHVESNCTLNWGQGMIYDDPLFVDPANDDFHLKWISPCINRGTNDGAPSEELDGDPRPYMGTVDIGADEFVGIHALEADGFSISELVGGTVNFTLTGGLDNNDRTYIVLGGVSGTAPGIALPGGLTTLPINWDAFTNIVLAIINSSYFSKFLGTLDATGKATALLNVPPVPGFAGLTMHYAYALNNPWNFVSNPISIQIIP